MRNSVMFLALAAMAPVSIVRAQVRVEAPMARAFSYTTDDPERPRIGVSTRSSGKRDTLGLLVESVTSGGPAEKAGLEEGDRLVSINAVNLRLAAADAGEPDMEGVATRRLIRELAKHKPGDDVELRLYRDGQTRTVRVKTADVDDLQPETATTRSMRSLADRAALGISMGGNGSRRDTLGILVIGVTDSGPAERAGIEEGDRIAMINTVDLRVAREDAGDWEASSSRIRRLNREMEKVKAGDDVELRVYGNGQTKNVRLKAAKFSELRDGGGAFFFGDMVRRAMTIPKRAIAPAIYRSRILDDMADLELRQQQLQLQSELRAEETLKRSLQLREHTETRRADLELRARAEREAVQQRARPRIATTARLSAFATPRAVQVAPRFSSANVLPVSSANVLPAVMASRAIARFSASSGLRDLESATVSLSGIRMAKVDSELATYFGEGSENGLLVLEARNGWQNLRAGDVVLAIEGRPVRSRSGGVSLDLGDGSRRTVDIIRGGRRTQVTLYRYP